MIGHGQDWLLSGRTRGLAAFARVVAQSGLDAEDLAEMDDASLRELAQLVSEADAEAVVQALSAARRDGVTLDD